jgi:hypothetical protein
MMNLFKAAASVIPRACVYRCIQFHPILSQIQIPIIVSFNPISITHIVVSHLYRNRKGLPIFILHFIPSPKETSLPPILLLPSPLTNYLLFPSLFAN